MRDNWHDIQCFTSTVIQTADNLYNNTQIPRCNKDITECVPVSFLIDNSLDWELVVFHFTLVYNGHDHTTCNGRRRRWHRSRNMWV